MNPQRYKNGKIYKIVNDINDQLYIGSTCLPLSKRLYNHKKECERDGSSQHQLFVLAREHGWSREPIIEMLIPSTVDDSLAPPGRHVASLFCQQFAPALDGKSWADARDRAAQTVFETVEGYAPGFIKSILGTVVLSPEDLEEEFGLTGGDIFHGALSLDQLFSARPVLGHGDYRSPVRGLYMCGSGTHPGGGVTGAPGHNAAREIIRDFRARRLQAI